MTAWKPLNVVGIQTALYWEAIECNLVHFDRILSNIYHGEQDLVVLPEMFTTGFSMNAMKLADHSQGLTLEWMRRQARKLNAALTGSVIIEDLGQYYNRLYFVWPEGNVEIYDKRHTFSYAGEDKVFQRGKQRIIIEYQGWKICPLICYDLRFPVWSRNSVDYDILIYVANWPSSRIRAWDTLLQARSIENMCYTIGVNRIGEDGNGINYPGHSVILDALGTQLSYLQNGEEGYVQATLDPESLDGIRKRYNFLLDRDSFRPLESE